MSIVLEIDEVPAGTPPPVEIVDSVLPDGAATEVTLAAVNTKLGAALPLPAGASTAALQTAGNGTLTTIDGKTVPPATAVSHFVVTMTNANQEYSQALPANTKVVTWRPRSDVDIRYSFVAGRVGTASPTGPYMTLRAGEVFNERNLNLAALTLYIATVAAGTIIEIETWS